MSDSSLDNFKFYTHQYNQYNEIYNVNRHLHDIGKLEHASLEDQNNTLRNNIMKMKNEYLLVDTNIMRVKFMTRIIYATLLVTSLMIVIAAYSSMGKFSPSVAISVCVVLAVILCVAVFSLVKFNSNRQKRSWNKFHFDARLP